MAEFIAALFALPTAVFTGLLGLSLVYWLFVIMGALDLDTVDALSGADGAVDGAIDGAVDGAVEGSLEGATEGAAHGVHATHMATDGAASGALAEVLSALRLRNAPATVTFSAFSFWAWLVSITGMRFVAPFIGDGLMATLAKVGVFLGTSVLSIGLTSLTIRPLGRLFAQKRVQGKGKLAGKTGTLTTSRVDGKFGQAEVKDDGAGLLLQVRCDEENTLKKGDVILIIDFDDDRDVYLVEPYEGLLAGKAKRPALPASTTTEPDANKGPPGPA